MDYVYEDWRKDIDSDGITWPAKLGSKKKTLI